jgi:hypothetical protein
LRADFAEIPENRLAHANRSLLVRLNTVKKASLAAVWPGLPELWQRGTPTAIGQALCFSILLNLCIVSTWGWTEVLENPVRATAWLVTLGFWGWGIVGNRRFLQGVAYSSAQAASGDLFPAAQREYLRGNWLETERLVSELLARNPSDIEAQLLLIALLRQTDNAAAALEQLDTAERMTGCERWRLEILRERSVLRGMVAADAKLTQDEEPAVLSMTGAKMAA